MAILNQKIYFYLWLLALAAITFWQIVSLMYDGDIEHFGIYCCGVLTYRAWNRIFQYFDHLQE